jgi:CRP/FNR family cyclic AMP-dependent transcriptional regulator
MSLESRDDIRAILGRHFLLRHLEASELDQLLKFAKLRHGRPNEVLFQKGDPGDGLIAIIEGRVKISTMSAEGKEIVLNILGPGELFGEIALIDGKDRSADATVMENAELVVIDVRDFMPFLEERPELATRLLVMLCERFRWVNDLYEDAIFMHLPARLAKHLIRLGESFGDESDDGVRIGIKLSQQDLGNLMGTTRESVNKQMRTWINSGIVSVDHGIITILDQDQLELFCDPF